MSSLKSPLCHDDRLLGVILSAAKNLHCYADLCNQAPGHLSHLGVHGSSLLVFVTIICQPSGGSVGWGILVDGPQSILKDSWFWCIASNQAPLCIQAEVGVRWLASVSFANHHRRSAFRCYRPVLSTDGSPCPHKSLCRTGYGSGYEERLIYEYWALELHLGRSSNRKYA